ncbi:VOC family protein [Streptomyces sp. NPDC059455]|uniref:VOC family protein n=1 Tax=Streptomyces sp. NPDC059455 TaxID=3346837 RepID=UPI00369846EA
MYARFGADVPDFFVRSRHLAIHVDTEEDLLEYRRRLDASEWPVELQIQHETIESIYTHDPNGYMFEITRALRPVLPQEDLDAQLTIEALLDVVAGPDPNMAALIARKAELIVTRAEAWEAERREHADRAGSVS